ncbi:tetratricopeptide repeat protein [Desulforhabdus sp. TSK]|uniref:tetratricopeptide repeat protein n=1 Tax=Desulforhabdus sp. TSK TaxID=2925014 RepID=UPI001FC85EBB|nr:tetratricopeptide repeat protein [Desulforhabdus sp. TSK]GKT09323.1 hypothetical protein DSTSK_26280 [Desulforhabdus sp. TSK]
MKLKDFSENLRRNLCRKALAILLLAPLTACATTKNTASNVFEETGYQKLVERQNALSSDDGTAAKKLPKMKDSDHEKLGDIYLQQGKFELAYVQYTKVLRKSPDNLGVVLKRGLVFLYRDLPEEGKKEFLVVLKKEPSNALALQAMGQALFQQKNYPEAEKYLREAVQANPKLWVPHNLLGIIYDYQGRGQEAIAHYETAVGLKPDEASLYNNLGVAYSLAGQLDKSIETFGKGLQISPRDEKLNNNLGMVLCKAGRYPEAVEAFKRCGDEAQALNNLGSYFFQEGEYEKAVRSFERAVRLRSAYYTEASENLKRAEVRLHSQTSQSFVEKSESRKATASKIVTDMRENDLNEEAPCLR